MLPSDIPPLTNKDVLILNFELIVTNICFISHSFIPDTKWIIQRCKLDECGHTQAKYGNWGKKLLTIIEKQIIHQLQSTEIKD